MKFGHLISDFKGPVRLMHGSDSGVCTDQQVKLLQREFPKAQVLEVAGAAHPVPFNAMVNQFVLQSLNLPVVASIPATPVRKMSAPQTVQMSIPLDTPVVTPQVLPEPVVEPEPAPPQEVVAAQSPVQPRVSFLGFLKQLLGATKK